VNPVFDPPSRRPPLRSFRAGPLPVTVELTASDPPPATSTDTSGTGPAPVAFSSSFGSAAPASAPVNVTVNTLPDLVTATFPGPTAGSASSAARSPAAVRVVGSSVPVVCRVVGATWVTPRVAEVVPGAFTGSVSVNGAVAPVTSTVWAAFAPRVKNSGSAVPNARVPPEIMFAVAPPTFTTCPLVTVVPPTGTVTVMPLPTTSRALIVAPRVTSAVAFTLLAS
jgi:hypothetical protein